MDQQQVFVVMGALIAAFFLVVTIVIGSRYTKAGPDEALVITGGRTGVRVVRGGGTFVWPVIESVKRLSLKVLTVRARASAFHSALGAPAQLETTAMVKVDATTEESLMQAAQNLLGGPDVASRIATEVIEQHMRSVLGTLEAEAVFKDIDKLGKRLQAAARPDLEKLGLQVVTFTLGVAKVDSQRGA